MTMPPVTEVDLDISIAPRISCSTCVANAMVSSSTLMLNFSAKKMTSLTADTGARHDISFESQVIPGICLTA